MSFTFNEVFKQASNKNLSFSVRWSCAKRCVWKYARFTEQEFAGTLERIGHAAQVPLAIIHMFPAHNSITEGQLSYLLAITHKERGRYIAKYNLYRVEREREKRKGRMRSAEAYRIFLAKPDYYDNLCIPLAPYQPLNSRKFGYINKEGELCITPQFDRAGPFIENKAQVSINGQQYIISSTGDIISSI